MSILGQFTQLLNGFPAWPLFIVLFVVALLLIFAGRKVVKVLAFVIVGLIGASIGGQLGAQYLSSLGWVGNLLGLLIGFVAGGLIGLLIVRVGIGIAVGYAAYLLTLDVVSNSTAALVVGFIFFVVGVVLYNKILTIVTAFAGGFLLYDALTFYLDPTVAAVIAVLVTAVGLWYDFGLRRRGSRSASWNATPTI